MIIAEIGQAHDGSLGMAHSYIDAIARIGVDTIKFQMHLADYESSQEEKFRINFSYEDKTRFEYWKRMEFSFNQWEGLKKHCDDKKINFLVTPFSLKAVDYVEKLQVEKYKIGSGDTNNHLLLKKVSETDKPIILSTGMSTFEEIDKSVNFITNINKKLSILQCTSNYPVSPENWGLNVINQLKIKYNYPIGYSDHSGDISAIMAATALGAEIVEFHVAFDKNMFGPDSSSSLNLAEVKLLVDGIKKIRKSTRNPIDKSVNSKLGKNKTLFSRSITVNKNLEKNHKLTIKDLETTKPGGFGIDPIDFDSVIGKKLKHNKTKMSFLEKKDLC